jgi:DNA/RNA-binding domain of Phe-tRNA-synthetase-like protein
MIHDPRFPGSDLTLDDDLRGALALGLLDAEPVSHDPLPATFDAERDQVIARWSAIATERAQADLPGLAEVRALFHRLDIDPTKTRPSSEALLRRVLQGKGLPRVNPVVDVCNLCSLEFQLPLGLYDRDCVRGAIRARAGRDGEGYEGIRKDRVNLAGRLLLADDDGPFGAPTSDSLRSAITARTRRLLVVVFCPSERAPSELTAALERIADRLTRFVGAQVMAVRVLQ